MNKKYLLLFILLFSIIALSCSVQTKIISSDVGEEINANVSLNSKPVEMIVPSQTVIQKNNTSTPNKPVYTITTQPSKAITRAFTSQPTATATILTSCPVTEGYTWSKVFPEDTSFISAIFPTQDQNFLVSAIVDSNDGIWVAKLNPKGEVIWQKKFLPSNANIKPAPNGNFLIEFRNTFLEIDMDGNIIHNNQMTNFQPNADGSYTVCSGTQVMKYTDPLSPLWVKTTDSTGVSGIPTTDGGAIFAYAGSYVDKSVYYAPFYTDIKVIKIDENGQVWQRVYGKLVGDETLNYVMPTNDGGTLLAGTHAYEDLGSDYDIWLMKVNKTAGISWQTTLKMAPNSEEISELYLLSQGILIVSNDNYSNELRLIKLTKNGALSWQKKVVSVRGRISIAAVADTSDGGLILSGQTEEMNNVTFLVRLDPKGQVLWEKLTGFYEIENSPDSFIKTILPLNDGNILLGGGTNLLGQGLTHGYGAWLSNIKDEGSVLGFLTFSPEKFSIISTLSSRPNNIPNQVTDSEPFPIVEIKPQYEQTDFQSFPACLNSGFNLPTPQALPSITPSVTPTPSFLRDLFLTTPENMHGDDVLMLQQRLLELGYEEVGVPDGEFGKMTQTAVRLFQEKNNLEVDGYVGPITWQKLFSTSAIPAN